MIDISQVRFSDEVVGFQCDLVQITCYFDDWKGYANKPIPLKEFRANAPSVEEAKKNAFDNLENLMKHRLNTLMGIFPEVISQEINRRHETWANGGLLGK